MTSQKQMPRYEVREWLQVGNATSENGKSRINIRCPFCGREVVAYKWSLAGSGKRCPQCKAIHHWFEGRTKKKIVDRA